MPAVFVEELPGPIDAAGVALALAGRPGLAWLDGDPAHPAGRRSYVACDPVEVRRASLSDADPLALLRDTGPHEPGSAAPRWIGYVAYDAAWAMESRWARRHARDPDTPVLWLARYDAVVEFDHATGRAVIVGDDRNACARLRERLAAGGRALPAGRITTPVEASPAGAHREAIESALGHIAAGDVYQVNLARRWRAGFEGEPLALWLAMRRASPVPLGMFLDAGDHAVLSRTMETFLDWEGPGGRLASRPIKGTIARAGDDDERVARVLRADDKERAEHAMIVDLVRNDLGRVAETGTVRVESVMEVEPFARLSHLVSTVACRTRADVGLAEIFRATFPPGSVTGAPKVRAVSIIEALEPHPRGVYCGCVGMIDRAGGARFAVAIRTARVAGGEVSYHAGGGIVSASNPAREVAETELKARAFLDAVDALAKERTGSTLPASRVIRSGYSGVV